MSDRIVVTLDDEGAADIASVSEELRRTGMHVDQVLEELGVITGSLGQADFAGLRGIRGIASVDTEETFGIP
ncbi:hypothetical protein [Actinopolyspora mortivallis]|uniref:Ketohydroxyglutarate aldolase n=1 Tax=Actinopolyspora mortivallis TaxID=33906 RepID=A0A2T0GS52_ACTMO|nr:hypothetical protein [Actinopolyspora mortivallis]PRW61948.1 hypothetical protein CEP50_18045 [Actinopolyspora mortivallis]